MGNDANGIIENIDRNKLIDIAGLPKGPLGLIISKFAMRNPNKTILVVTSGDDNLRAIVDDITFFARASDRERLLALEPLTSLPFSRISPEPDTWTNRLRVLKGFTDNQPSIVVASIDAILRRLPPRKFLDSGTKTIRTNEEISLDDLIAQLIDTGYEDVGIVEDEGTFAKRGGIVDIWSPTEGLPTRIELDGDKILSMRGFDPATQRSKKSMLDIRSLTIIPAREIPFDRSSRNRAAHMVRDRSESPLSAGERRMLIEAIHEGIVFSGMESLLPLFHEETATIFDYLPNDTLAVIVDEIDVEAAAKEFTRAINELHEETKSLERIIEPHEIAIGFEEFRSSMSNYGLIRTGSLDQNDAHENQNILTEIESNQDIRPMIQSHSEGEDMLAPLVSAIRKWHDESNQVILTCHTRIQAERLGELFHVHGLELMDFDAPFDTLDDLSNTLVKLRIGRLSAGFRWPDEKLVIITDEEIFGRKISRRTAPRNATEPFTSLTELAEGDPIVHEQHGIGRYRGLIHLELNGIQGDYVLLEYLGGDKLYLPVYRLNLMGKYIGSGDAPPPIDKLGGIRWSNVRSKVRRDIGLIAKDLLRLFAERKIHPGFAFPDGGTEYEEFCAAFAFDETPDQANAIEEVMNDMSEAKPSDRLICGDVGYGKTEVAMRAAYRAAMAGKQVSLLVPTTVLAFQHYENFLERFKDTPLKIEMLSRFRKPKERKRIVEDLRRGAVDIVIGTHRLLQKDVKFKNLGLLVVDEEHRFGVKHKERIKELKSTVDVVSMTATPIPRTLNMALVGIRDISVINTPPVDRQSVATFVVPFDEGIIRQAILREKARGGQVFFVHNRVETIGAFFRKLQDLVPEVKIEVGHGKMKESELEKVMIDFLDGSADVLLCTTIIESGLDIPNANTIIVHRADNFGLAQLYQLRGRVGRSNVKAHAYLLTPPDGEITTIAKKRLAVLKRFTELGSGFQVAMHDLEFRGAGNILGSAQSGHINAIGYELYAKLLDRTMRQLKGESLAADIDPELGLKVSAFLPEDYVPDQATRVELYRKLATREDAEEIDNLADELIDRFGELPTEANNLIGLMQIKVIARMLKIVQINFEGGRFSIKLDESTPLKTEDIIELAAKDPSKYRLIPPDKLLILAENTSDEASILKSAKNSLSMLARYATRHDHV